MARHHLIEDYSQREDIRSLRCLAAVQKFRRHVAGCAACDFGGDRGFCGQSKIGNDRAGAAIFLAAQNDISGFKVTVQNAASMGFSYARAELAGDLQCFWLVELAFLQPVCEGLAIQKLHGEKIHLAEFSRCGMDFIHYADVRMPDLERAFQLR